jgi:polysaccharide export outer membrane protein
LQAAVEKSFERYYYNPRISVEIADHRSQPVSVLGSVTKPGIYQLQGRKTLADVLSMAGGLKPDAGYTVRISRASDAQSSEARERVFSYSVSEILKGGTGDDVLVSPHDVITVPRAELIYVIGDVRKAGGFALEEKENASVLQALALAEGALPTASLKACTILRPQVAGAERVSIPVNVKHLMSGKASDVMLQAGDVLIVPSSTIRKIGVKTAEAALQTASGIAIWRRP